MNIVENNFTCKIANISLEVQYGNWTPGNMVWAIRTDRAALCIESLVFNAWRNLIDSSLRLNTYIYNSYYSFTNCCLYYYHSFVPVLTLRFALNSNSWKPYDCNLQSLEQTMWRLSMIIRHLPTCLGNYEPCPIRVPTVRNL